MDRVEGIIHLFYQQEVVEEVTVVVEVMGLMGMVMGVRPTVQFLISVLWVRLEEMVLLELEMEGQEEVWLFLMLHLL
jgi:hypothetical protein